VKSPAAWPVFSYGFRPLFLSSGVVALLAVPVWLWVQWQQLALWGGAPPVLWHAHEMLFGFIGAAVAGFLLTAVPSWTSSRGFAGWPLVLLVLVWLAARVLLLAGPDGPWRVAVLLQLAFLPLLAALIAPPILRERNRNVVMLVVLAALWGSDAVFLYAVSVGQPELAARMLRFALDILLLLITIIGGRIVPAFTSNALRRNGETVALRSVPWLERVLPALMLVNAAAGALGLTPQPLGFIALLAAALHGWRLAGWRGLRVGREPILWVLHLAYAWLPLGFVLKALALWTLADFAKFWLHAFGIGAAATMIVAVMTRASLGHTGRPLIVARSIAWAYGLLTLAAVSRVLLPHLGFVPYPVVLLIAGAFWTAAFAIFVAVYGPILIRPRLDGRAG
jgi:uncharacterized protein involved in response to NO